MQLLFICLFIYLLIYLFYCPLHISNEITQWHWRKQRLLTYVLNGATVFISGLGRFSLLPFGFKVFQGQFIYLLIDWLIYWLFIYMNTCWAHSKCFAVAKIALSSLRLRCSNMQLWMSHCSFTQRVLNVHRSGYSAVWLLHGWCHVKLLPFWRMFCAPYTAMHQFTVSPYCHEEVMLNVLRCLLTY